MRVLLLTRYTRLGASSRLRSYQYLPYLEKAGIEVCVAPLFNDDYVRSLSVRKRSKLAIIWAYIKRLQFILKVSQFDFLWVEKEMLPWIPAWLEISLLPNNIPFVVDYDDAVFHRYDQHHLSIVRKILGDKIDAVMRRADLVIVGNDYLGLRAKNAGAKRIKLLPTVVDMSRYQISAKNHSQLTIGWIGQTSTSQYLASIVPVLQKIIDLYGVRVVAVGANELQFKDLPIHVTPWAEATEVSEIEQFDIGIMPLSDDAWEKGKCGYKLIQYMACRKPVIASPVGVNKEIVVEGVNGFLANNSEEWFKALQTLCEDAQLRERFGKAGQQRVEQDYCLQVTAPRLQKLFYSVLEGKASSLG